MNMSNPATLTRWLTLALAAGFVTLVAAFVPSPLRLFDLFDAAPELEVHAPPQLKMTAMPPQASFAAISARPIFNAGRKPDPQTAVSASSSLATQPVQGDLSQFRLVGIVTDSVTQRALIARAGQPTLRLSPGDRLAGWRIEKIDSTGVVATSEGRSTKIVIPRSELRTATP
ncbi:MAG: hypothetical protein K8S25_02940 [Alphaproteobacteria bacterium]|nr:hypothetical protein [Alphaproteobacteria bacterium]